MDTKGRGGGMTKHERVVRMINDWLTYGDATPALSKRDEEHIAAILSREYGDVRVKALEDVMKMLMALTEEMHLTQGGVATNALFRAKLGVRALKEADGA